MEPASTVKVQIPAFSDNSMALTLPDESRMYTRFADWTSPVYIPPHNFSQPQDNVDDCVPVIPVLGRGNKVVMIPVKREDFQITKPVSETNETDQKAQSEPVDETDLESLYRILFTHDFTSRETALARGLYNSKNRCFFNAMLQVLIHCTPLYSLLLDIQEHELKLEDRNPVLVALVKFAYDYTHTGDLKRAFNANELYTTVCSTPSFNIELDRQEDAQEFLGSLLDVLETIFSSAKPDAKDDLDEELQRRLKAKSVLEARSNETEGDWVEVGQNSKPIETQHVGHQDLENPIQALFGGRFQSTLVRGEGKKPSITTEPFSQIPLDISDNSIYSIQTAFEHMLAAEELLLDNVEATKTIKFQRTPPVLVANLKRFTVQMTDGMFQYGKINKSIEIDSKLIINSGVDKFVYEPFGVVYHHGSRPETGHYTADIKVGDQWYKIDDEQVVPVDKQKVVGDSASSLGSGSAYIVVYLQKERI